ncbi:MAG: peptidoglycan-binding protein [Candidatus Pacebacteria bacterium]|nr:peptidoglycan-binding protein [Candidatus Paceibacterota bacterium]
MKKIGFILSLVVLFSFGANTAKAVTLADLEKTVVNLQNQVSSLQSQLATALYSLNSSTLSSGTSATSSASSSTTSSGTSSPTSSTSTVTTSPTTTSTTVPTSSTSEVSTQRTDTSSSTYVSRDTTSASSQTTSVNSPIARTTTDSTRVNSSTSLNTGNTIATAKLGDRGANVLAIQKILKDRGYLKATPNGTFGPSTQKAVRAFQSANKIYAGGGVGPATLRVLADVSTDRVDVMTTDVSSASLLVTRNMAYPDQTVSTGTIHHKIGSYYVKNQSAVESAKVTGLLFGFTTGGTASVSQLTNIKAYNSSGVQIGATIPTIGSTATVSISSSFTLSPLASTVVDVYADIGTAPTGSGWRSNLLASGVGLTSGAMYHSGSSVSVQSVTIGTSTACTGTWAKVVSPNGGEVYTVGATMHITWNTCGHATSAPVQIGIRDSRYSLALASGEETIISTTNTGSYNWAIPATLGMLSGGTVGGTSVYTIVIYVSGGGPTTHFDESDARFTINGTSTSTGLVVTKNTAYANQTFPAGSIDKKIASFFVQNFSSESIMLTGLQAGMASTTIPTTGFSNFKAYDGVGGQIGVTSSSFGSTTFLPGSSLIIPAGAAFTIELKVDIGSTVSTGSFIQRLRATGTGVSTSTTYNSGVPTDGQTITIGTSSCTINSFTASPTTVASGGSSTLSWNTTGCWAIEITAGVVGTTTSVGLSGSQVRGPITSTTTYTLTAGSSTGGTATATTTVTVTPTTTGWIQRTSAGSDNWRSLASSSDRSRIAAIPALTGGANIYISTDGGISWTPRTVPGAHQLWSLAMSSDGMRLIAGDNNGYIYTSTDGGVVWVTRTSPGMHQWWGVASSSDGMKLAAGDAYYGYIYTSINGGATWTQRMSTGGHTWSMIRSSYDGNRLVAIDAYSTSTTGTTGGYLYTSNDGGATWTKQLSFGPARNWTSISLSSDGMRVLALDQTTNAYISTDGGVTFTSHPIPIGSGVSGTSSADGMTLAVGNNAISISTDGGITWSLESIPGVHSWLSISSSADGTKFIAGDVGPGYMWTKN